MCNLNILINLKKQPTKNCAFLSGATAVSYRDDNKDGDGIYFDNDVIVRSKDKLNLFNYFENFKNSKLMISHQRHATSGKSEKYTQPFESPHFVMAHNGVLNDYVNKNKSDTFVVFTEFIKLFNKSKGNREKRIIKATEKLFKDEYGNWSVVLYDKKTKNLYYFKDSTTNIKCSINKSKDILYLTTKDDNEVFLHIFNEVFEEVDIDDYTLYRFTFRNKITVKKVVELDQRYTYKSDDDDDDKKFHSPITKKTENKPLAKWFKSTKLKDKTDRAVFGLYKKTSDEIFHDTEDESLPKTDTKFKIQFHKYMVSSGELKNCEYCQLITEYHLKYSEYCLCPKCFKRYYENIIREERFYRDVQNGTTKPTTKEFFKRFNTHTGRAQ